MRLHRVRLELEEPAGGGGAGGEHEVVQEVEVARVALEVLLQQHVRGVQHQEGVVEGLGGKMLFSPTFDLPQIYYLFNSNTWFPIPCFSAKACPGSASLVGHPRLMVSFVRALEARWSSTPQPGNLNNCVSINGFFGGNRA